MKIYFAPLQGYTDAVYRNIHNKYFGGIEKYYTPYLRFEPNKQPKKSVIKDLLPENNTDINIVPQLLGKDIDLFIEHIKRLEQQGYKEVNWNLACPFPMVYKRGFGSGLLKNPKEISIILEDIIPKINLPLSIKCRLGFENENEFSTIIDELNNFYLLEIIVHTRTAKQMYKGETTPSAFKEISPKSQNKLIYNGDIKSVENLDILSEEFMIKPDTIMIGRGLLENPFLATEINGNISEKKRETLKDFHSELYLAYEEKLEKPHLLTKLQKHWEYLSHSFVNQHKVHKLIKKASSIKKYDERIYEIFLSEEVL